MVLMETWLHLDLASSQLEVDGSSLVWADRSAASGKNQGGGVCVFVNEGWCTQFTVRSIVYDTDIELLCLSMRPFYLPREFGNIIICGIYVPPSGNAARAAEQIHDCVQQQIQRTPSAHVFILGDFNHCKLELILPGFEQYIKCCTRDNRILDKCYGIVKRAYVAKSRPPLASSDHNTVYLTRTEQF